MVGPPWLTVAFGALGLMPWAVAINPPVGMGAQAADVCPERCAVSGPQTGNWSVYPDFKVIKRCQQTMFFDFSIYDPVDDPNTTHRIHACSSFSSDFGNIVPSAPVAAKLVDSASSVEVEFELGWWHEGFGLAKAGIQSLVTQIRDYIDRGHGPPDRPFILYGQSGQATIGLYIGQGLLSQGLSASGLQIFQDNLDNIGVTTPSLAMQLCGPDHTSTHIFGVAVTSNGTFAPIQNAIKSWANATCLSFLGSKSFPGTAKFTKPLLKGASLSSSTLTNSTHDTGAKGFAPHSEHLQERAECRTVQAEAGEGCAELAVKCGISGDEFTKYNPGIRSSLRPKQHVCCSSGTLPDFRPRPNPDGSCFSYTVQNDDNCANLAAEYGLTNEEIESFNKKTWGWSGCELLYAGTIMCLSTGMPPFPAPIQNAVCGPQKPGTKPPTDGSDIAELNPCPLNACCNIWGQCGITKDFCIDTNTGAPGTAKPGTYGCISNCGLDVIKGKGDGSIRIAYLQGYGLNRKYLSQDTLQIDTSKYTHIHFGFAVLTPSYEVKFDDLLISYEFGEFKRIGEAKRILSFGGWDFSTSRDTYFIFREGVKPANRLKMASNLANFIKEHDLDGIDIDWEYPGAPDLPPDDPGKEEDGPNYLAFLAILKNLLPGKSVSITAPASYWYLKQFPIKEISRIVDYIVYMTYDLHGQWEGCDTGNCLRSQINLTETKQALAMITKAGVPGEKIVVGVASYGRSFEMEQPGCWGPECKFTGSRFEPRAKPGRCTDNTAGYIADAEIKEMIDGESGGSTAKRQSRVVAHFLDTSSNSDILLVSDDNQWAAYMSEDTKRVRTNLYANWGMAGTTDWASDLQEFHDPPKPAKDRASFIALAANGEDPKEDPMTLGHWKEFTCEHPAISDLYYYYPWERWEALDADSAWREILVKWFKTDRARGLLFSESVEQTLKSGPGMNCQTFAKDKDHCDHAITCPDSADSDKSGPAARLVWNALIEIHSIYHGYYDALLAAQGQLNSALDDLENTFAPISEPESNQWLLILIDLITIGSLTTAGPFFNGYLKTLDALNTEQTYDNVKGTSMNMINQVTALAKNMLENPEDDGWAPEKQDKFSHYIGQVIFGWRNATERAVQDLFRRPDQDRVNVLGKAMANGTLTEGRRDRIKPKINTQTELVANVLKTVFGFTIPALWRRSKTYAFVLDSGAGCGGNPASKYVNDTTADETSVCYNGRLYYLVHPDGDARECRCERVTDTGPCQTTCRDNTFSAPVGLSRLGDFGRVTKEELVKGAVRTWIKKGRTNEGEPPDPIKDESVKSGLVDMDITTPGFVRLPVCSADRAFRSWNTAEKGSSPNYPCDIPPGIDRCGASSFEDQTSDASPKVSDCRQIIRNIEGDASTEWTHRITGHREILSYGTCHFGIERTGGTGGAVEFKVGGQDVIDIINDSIKKFGGSGKIGAKGVMPCDGTTVGTTVNVLWGIY
ncbi:hypothetical protein VTH82DRAFT_5376 [Thermothelomyces myriococcoides]